MNVADAIVDLNAMIARHVAAKRERHGAGECAGIDCPYCDFERQYPGKPHYLIILERERAGR